MSKIKKMICLLLSVIMVLSLNVPAFANDNTQNSINSLSTTEITEQLQITVSTDKYSYNASSVATIYVSVKNVSDKTLKNVKTQVVFDDLQPVSVRKSTTSLEIAELQAGESFDFSYKATLNINKHDLNIFQKVFLWIVRLFNGGYTATNNSIDVVAENVTDIIFGKFTAKNVIQIGYESNITSNDSTEEQIQQIEYVKNSIDDFCNSNEYKNSSSEEQISLIKRFLNELEKNGEIKNIIFTTDGWVTFEFKNGWESGIELMDSHTEDCFQSSTSSAYIDDTRYATEILTLSKNTYSNKFDKWTFSIGTTDSCYSIQELANQYSALGMSIDRKELATVQTYKEFSGSEFIYIHSHGDTIDGIPVIKTEEIVTKEKEDLYEDIINRGDVKAHKIKKTGIWYFYIYPSFFENNYKNNELNDAIVYIGSCNAFGNNNSENHSFYESFKKAGASTVIGFCNSVNVGYSNYFAERLLSYLSLGYSIGESFNEAVNVLGENGNIFWEQYGEPNIRKDDEYPAYPIIRGETNITLFDKQIDGLGTFTATISDGYTNNPIENVAVEIKSTANIELYHLLKTNSNGTFSIYLPEGNYTCELIHKDYVRKEFEFNVEADNNIVILNSYYLTPKTYLMGTVIDYETNSPVEDASVLLQKIDEAGLIVGEYVCSTDKDGKFEISVPVGNYTYTINKLDMLNELYETATGTVTVSNVTGNVLATVYLSPKNSSGETERTVIDSGNCGADGDNVTWTLYEDGELVISGSGEMEKFYSSTKAPWYSNKEIINNVSIDYGITNISSYSFYDCKNLTDIKIPDSVTIIDSYSFYSCENLTDIKIPDSVTIISIYAFSYCESLADIIIPNNVTEIQNWAFAYTGLVNVIIPENVKTIGGAVFYGCEHLKTVKILNGVEKINTAYSNSYKFESYYGTFEECKNLTQISIPNSVTNIGVEAFAGCSSLENISIPDSVTSIGGGIFYNCSSLKSVVLSNNITNLSNSYYYSYNSASSYSTEYYHGFFEGCVSLCEISIPESVTNLGIETFAGCTDLTAIIIPDSVVSIGGGSFYNCSSLENVKLSNNVKELSYTQYGQSKREINGFFELCSNLETVTIPNGLTLIDAYTFRECSNLKSITIPNSVKTIGQEVFSNCCSLNNIIISNSITEIPDKTFYNCSNLSEVEIPNSVISIGGQSFENCINIKKIKIPDSVTSIYYSAFEDCTSLSDIDIGNRTQYVGKNAFYNTAYYNDSSNWDNGILYIETILIAAERDISDSIFIKSGTTVIAGSAFANCDNFSQINIPETVTKISSQAFYGCDMLKCVTIPLSVTTIESGAFSFCKKLSEIIILNPNCEIADYKNTICTSSQATIGYYYNGKITGYRDSTAEAYAKKYDITFVALD